MIRLIVLRQHQKNNIMEFKKYISAIILAIAFVIGTDSVSDSIVKFKTLDRQITVKGLAEKEVPADKVTWPLQYKEMGNDPAEMYLTLEKKNKIVLDFLKQGGIKDDEISINPPTITDRQANDYASMESPFRYKAISTITVTSKDVDKVRRLLNKQGELIRQGVPVSNGDYGQGVVYDFTGLNDIKPSMIEEATKNAKATAKKFASDSDSEIGKISNASQGQFTIEDRDSTTPYIKKVRIVVTIKYFLKD